jgi:hypothetical protein
MDAHVALLRLLVKLEQATRDGHVWIGAGDAENALDAIARLNTNAEALLCP